MSKHIFISQDQIHKLREMGVNNGNEVFLYGIIYSEYTNYPSSGCLLSDDELSEIYGTSKRNVQRYIKHLVEAEVILVDPVYVYDERIGGSVEKRKIIPLIDF